MAIKRATLRRKGREEDLFGFVRADYIRQRNAWIRSHRIILLTASSSFIL
jgi:hypothetical protein